MFIDEAEITIKAGDGGNGLVSFHKPPVRGPDGGNGGSGGDVFIKTINDITALARFAGKKYFAAINGQSGGRNRKTGKDGNSLEITMPLGTTITDLKTQESLELTQVNQIILIGRGGKGGKGNFEFRSSRNTTPRYAEKGGLGQEKNLKLNLRLIADFGLIGLPNAGKSSLLNELTAAHVKIASYPFTTLEPNLGALNGKIIADIPGLIEGASSGKGLGIKFLKHIEKVALILHCISCESSDALKDYQVVKTELLKYSPALAKKKEIILLTKTDLVTKTEYTKKITILKKLKKKVYPVSIHDWDSLEKLKQVLGY
jgi:GTP-binding protein